MDNDKKRNHLQNLKKWNVDARVQERIEGTGFDGLLRLTTFPVNPSLPLLPALIECYDIESRCFVFNNHKLVYGLEDVLYITGLPVDCDPVTVSNAIHLDGNVLCKQYLGLCPTRNQTKNKNSSRKGCEQTVKLNWLRQNFEVVPEHIDRDSPWIEPYVRAFILFLIGAVVVPDTCGNNVPLMYLPLLENLQSSKNYAWGAALLAHLHVSLENSKRNSSHRVRRYLGEKSFSMGHSYSLLVFALERIPKLVLRFCFDGVKQVDGYLPKTFPLLLGWTNLLCGPSQNNFKHITEHDYLQILGELDEDDIVWQPYKRLPHDFLPQYCRGQEKIVMSRTVLLCFDKAAYHRPDLSPKQFGIQEVNTSTLRPLIELETYDPNRKKGINWGRCGYYECYKEEWKDRAHSLIIKSMEEGHGSPTFEANESSMEVSSVTSDDEVLLHDLLVNPNHAITQPSTCFDVSSTQSSLPQVDVHNYGQVPANIHPSAQSLRHPSHSGLFPIVQPSSHKIHSSTNGSDDLSSLLADLSNLLRGSGTHPLTVGPTTTTSVDSAKEAICGILYRGFDALTDSEAQQVFLSSSEALLSAGVFPSYHLKTRLTSFRNELPYNASAFLQAQKDIHTTSELSFIQDFLKEQTAKFPGVLESLCIADEKIAYLEATLNATRENRAKMDAVVSMFVEQTKIAKQKLDSMNPQAAEIESKKLAAKEFIGQCHTSWGDLRISLLRFL